MSENKRFTLRNQQEELDDFIEEDIIDFLENLYSN